MNKIMEIMIKEFLMVLRDRRMLFFLILPPIIQIVILGYAIVLDVKKVSTSFLDLDNSIESREILRKMEGSGYFKIKYFPKNERELKDLLERGKVLLAIQINKGFSKDIKRGKIGKIQAIFDGTDSNTTSIALSYLNKIILSYCKELMGIKSNFEQRIRIWYNPELESKNYNIPAVIAMIVMLTCLILTSMAIVREREEGTLEMLLITPIKPLEIILGKTLPFGIIAFFDTFLVLIVGILWFKIPFKGSFLILLISTGIYILSAIGIGLFISTISKTMPQAMLITFLFFAPAVLLSGLLFPIENMPSFFQYITYLNPLRYFLKIIRDLFLKGIGAENLFIQIFPLFVIGVCIITFSTLRFKKRLD